MNANDPAKSAARAPTENEIRERAYHLYEQSGRVPGRDWENWLRAEGELLARAAPAEPAIPQKWQWHYRALLRLREKLQRAHAEHAAAARAPRARDGADAADIASDASEHDTLLAEISLEQAELAEVEAALARLRAGTYGVCEATGEPIDAARLRAVPWARVNVPRPHNSAAPRAG